MAVLGHAAQNYTKVHLAIEQRLCVLYAMPKLPRNKHPLRTVRHALSEGKILESQEAFAKRVGTTRSKISNAEAGRGIDDALAAQISAQLGVRKESILSDVGPALDFLGNPYTASSFRKFKAWNKDPSSASNDDLRANLIRMVDILTRAATENGDFQKLYFELFEFMQKLRSRFDLCEAIDRVLKEEEENHQEGLTIDQLETLQGFSDPAFRRAFARLLPGPLLEAARYVSLETWPPDFSELPVEASATRSIKLERLKTEGVGKTKVKKWVEEPLIKGVPKCKKPRP